MHVVQWACLPKLQEHFHCAEMRHLIFLYMVYIAGYFPEVFIFVFFPILHTPLTQVCKAVLSRNQTLSPVADLGFFVWAGGVVGYECPLTSSKDRLPFLSETFLKP